MTTEQHEHEGFEHTGEYRAPQYKEFYQYGSVWGQALSHAEKRKPTWILRKLPEPPAKVQFEGFRHTGEFRKPRQDEWFQANVGKRGFEPMLYTFDFLSPNEYRWILIRNTSRTVAAESLKKDLNRALFHADHAKEDLIKVIREVEKLNL